MTWFMVIVGTENTVPANVSTWRVKIGILAWH